MTRRDAKPATELTVSLRWSPSAPRAGRLELEKLGAGRLAPTALETAKLLLSELITNAYRHAGMRDGDTITLTLGFHGDSLRVEVADAGRSDRLPQRRTPGEGGWGLELLERMASRWGVVTGPPTKVWFELDGAVRRRASDRETSAAEGDASAEALRGARIALERAHEQALRLQRITAELAAATTPDDIAAVVTGTAHEALDLAHTWYYTLAEDGKQIELAGVAGIDPELARRYESLPIDRSTGIGHVIRTGQARFYSDRAELASDFPDYGSGPLAAPERSHAFLPLLSGTRVAGALALAWHEAHGFDAEERRFLETIATQCAQAHVRAQLYVAERRARAAAERGHRRVAFIADAAAILDASLDRRTTLQALADLGVPSVADWCAVDMLDPAGRLQTVSIAHRDPERVAATREARRLHGPTPGASQGAYRVLRSGQPELDTDLAEGDDPDGLHALGAHSAIIVPLAARGRILGVVTLALSEPDRRYGRADLMVTHDLVKRAALAIDNARLYEERSDVARALQESLLPAALPEVDGVELAARYRPASLDVQVGGDFYDVHTDDAGGLRLIVGDVCGKGAEAAALTALARYTMRAVGDFARTPEAVLRALNDAMRRQVADYRFVSVVYCQLLADRRTLRVVCAGHPPPLLLRADGSATAIAARGWLLGIHDRPPLETAELEVGPGDALVAYTDGVLEADPAAVLEPDALAAHLSAYRAEGASALAGELERLATETAHGRLRDDVAIVAARL